MLSDNKVNSRCFCLIFVVKDYQNLVVIVIKPDILPNIGMPRISHHCHHYNHDVDDNVDNSFDHNQK